MNSHQENFFFDFPLVDANTIAFSSLRLVYHGSTHGAFGLKRSPLDLREVDAIKISLNHLSTDPLSDEYEYNLIYLNDSLSEAVWNGQKRDNTPALMKITRRVLLAASPSLNAKRFRTPFWVKFTKPIYLARYNKVLIDDNTIPVDYLRDFHNKYQGFLTRTKKGYPLVRNTLESLGLKTSDRRYVKDSQEEEISIICYQA